jgi:hypothetical protein
MSIWDSFRFCVKIFRQSALPKGGGRNIFHWGLKPLYAALRPSIIVYVHMYVNHVTGKYLRKECLGSPVFNFRDGNWYCATSRKVPSSIPDGVIGILHRRKPSDRTTALWVGSASNRNENQEYPRGGGGYRQQVCRADKLSTFMCRLSWNLGASTSWNPQGLSKECFCHKNYQ